MSKKGTLRQSIITGVNFRSNDPEEQVEPTVVGSIVHGINNNPKFKKEVVSAIMQDTDCVNVMASAVMNCKASDIGISVPGTLAEFFQAVRGSKSTKAPSKVSKKARKSNKKGS